MECFRASRNQTFSLPPTMVQVFLSKIIYKMEYVRAFRNQRFFFFATNHGWGRDKAVQTIIVLPNLVTTLPHSNSNPVLAPISFFA